MLKKKKKRLLPEPFQFNRNAFFGEVILARPSCIFTLPSCLKVCFSGSRTSWSDFGFFLSTFKMGSHWSPVLISYPPLRGEVSCHLSHQSLNDPGHEIFPFSLVSGVGGLAALTCCSPCQSCWGFVDRLGSLDAPRLVTSGVSSVLLVSCWGDSDAQSDALVLRVWDAFAFTLVFPCLPRASHRRLRLLALGVPSPGFSVRLRAQPDVYFQCCVFNARNFTLSFLFFFFF